MKKDLKRLVAFFICFIILLSSSITFVHADYTKDTNGTNTGTTTPLDTTEFYTNGKNMDEIFDFTITDVQNLPNWIFEFTSFTVIKKYQNTDGEEVYKCYFNAPNIQTLAKTLVTSYVDDGYSGSTYDVNKHGIRLVEVGEDASSENIMTKYGFSIPCNTYMGEYPQITMSIAGVVPKTFIGAVWRAVKGLFGVSFIKAPDTSNFRTLTYLNHTYIDESQLTLDFFKYYYRPYFEKQIAKVKCDNNDEYFKDVDDYLDLAVSDDVAALSLEYCVNNEREYKSIKIQRKLWDDWDGYYHQLQSHGVNNVRHFRKAIKEGRTYTITYKSPPYDLDEYCSDESFTVGEDQFENHQDYDLSLDDYMCRMPSVQESVKNFYNSHNELCYVALYKYVESQVGSDYNTITSVIKDTYGIDGPFYAAPDDEKHLLDLALALNWASWHDAGDHFPEMYLPELYKNIYVDAEYTWTDETGDGNCDTCGNPVSNHHGFTDQIGPNGSQGADGLCDICNEASDDSRHDGAPDYEGQTVEHPNYIGYYTDSNGQLVCNTEMTYYDYIAQCHDTYTAHTWVRDDDNVWFITDIKNFYYKHDTGLGSDNDHDVINVYSNYAYKDAEDFYDKCSLDQIVLTEEDFIDEKEDYIEKKYEEYAEQIDKHKTFIDLLSHGEEADNATRKEVLYRQCLIESDSDDECISTKYGGVENTLSVSEVYIYSGIYKVTKDYADDEDVLKDTDAQEILTKLQSYCGLYYPEVIANMKVMMCSIAYNEDTNMEPYQMTQFDDVRVMPFDVQRLSNSEKLNYSCSDPRVELYRTHAIGQLKADGQLDESGQEEIGSTVFLFLMGFGLIKLFKPWQLFINIGGFVTQLSVLMQQLMDFNALDALGLSPTTMWSGPFVAMMMILLASYFIIRTVIGVIKMGSNSFWKTLAAFFILVFELGIITAIAAAPEKTWDIIKKVDSYVINLGEMAAVRSDKIDYLFDGANDTEVMYYLPYFDLWSKYNTGYGLMDDEQEFDYTTDAAELNMIDKNLPQINGNDINHYSVLLADSFSYYGSTTSTKFGTLKDGKLVNGNRINNNAYRVVDHFMAPRVTITQPTADTVHLEVTQNENYNGQFQSFTGSGIFDILVKFVNCFLMCFLSLIKFLTFLWQWWVFYIFIFRVILGRAAEHKTGKDILIETFSPTIALVAIGFYTGILMRIFMTVEGLLGLIFIIFCWWLTFRLIGWWHGLDGGKAFPLLLIPIYRLTNATNFNMNRQNRDLENRRKNATSKSTLSEEEIEKRWNEDGSINQECVNDSRYDEFYKMDLEELHTAQKNGALDAEQTCRLQQLETYKFNKGNNTAEQAEPTEESAKMSNAEKSEDDSVNAGSGEENAGDDVAAESETNTDSSSLDADEDSSSEESVSVPGAKVSGESSKSDTPSPEKKSIGNKKRTKEDK